MRKICLAFCFLISGLYHSQTRMSIFGLYDNGRYSGHRISSNGYIEIVQRISVPNIWKSLDATTVENCKEYGLQLQWRMNLLGLSKEARDAYIRQAFENKRTLKNLFLYESGYYYPRVVFTCDNL